MRKLAALGSLCLLALLAQGQEALDMEAVSKIKKEGTDNSRVMDIAFHLTDVSGPRLTNSPGFDRAARWAIAELSKWGITGAKLEPWGEFGKGWELQKSYIAQTAPYYRPLIGFPKAWTAGTKGLKSADLLLVQAKDSAQLESYRGKLAGRILILDRTDTLKHSFKADAERYTDEELTRMAGAALPTPRPPMDSAQRRAMQQRMSRSPAALANRLKEWAKEEGAVAIFSMTPLSHDGTVFVQGGGAYAATAPENFTDIALAMEDYLSLCRLARSGQKVRLDVEVQTAFVSRDTRGYNVIAEIKGSDPRLKEEVVMLGGHLDSWQGSTGATDNAAGCAVMMEALRILKATGLKPKRTIRLALWSGEEQGLLGSRGYVKQQFSDSNAHKKFSVYFNMDNGTGKFRGVYLQGNEGVKPIFTRWLEPFQDMGAKTVTLANTGGTDHLAFDAVGLPGFQFIQDPIEYDTRTHHTNMDSYDHLIAADLMHNALIVASFIYHAANRPEKLPRKSLPAATAGRPI